MGAPCSCGRSKIPVQLEVFEAVVAKPIRQNSTFDSPDPSSQATRVLAAYLLAERNFMSKKLIKLFDFHIEHPGTPHIQLKFCPMQESDWKHFAVLVETCKYARQLVVWKTGLSSKGFRTLCKAIATLDQLELVTLEDIGLGHHRIGELAKELKVMKRLRTISLAVNDLEPEQMEVLAPAIGQIRTLQEVNLDENKVGDKGCLLVCKALEQLEGLTFLSLRYNSISHLGFHHLISLGLRHSTLKVFAEGNEIEERELDHLSSLYPNL